VCKKKKLGGIRIRLLDLLDLHLLNVEQCHCIVCHRGSLLCMPWAIKIVITLLTLSGYWLMRHHCRCWPLDGGIEPDCPSVSSKESLHGLCIQRHRSPHWTRSSWNGHRTSRPEKLGPMQSVSPLQTLWGSEHFTAVAAAQTMAIGTSNSVACWPCWILDVKRWLCFSANDIPQVEVKTNSFRTEMMQGCWNGFVRQRRPV